MNNQHIYHSEFYMAIVTDAFLQDDDCLEQLEWAKLYEKPCIFLINKGTELPENFFEGIKSHKDFYYSGPEEFKQQTKKMVDVLTDYFAKKLNIDI